MLGQFGRFLLTCVIILVPLAAIAALLEDDEEPASRVTGSNPIFRELLEPYENLGCEGTATGTRLTLVVTGDENQCTLGAIVTAEALGIELPERDPDDPFNILGTHRGRDYLVVVGAASDLGGLEFTFSEG